MYIAIMPQIATGSFRFNPDVKKSAGCHDCDQSALMHPACRHSHFIRLSCCVVHRDQAGWGSYACTVLLLCCGRAHSYTHAEGPCAEGLAQLTAYNAYMHRRGRGHRPLFQAW